MSEWFLLVVFGDLIIIVIDNYRDRRCRLLVGGSVRLVCMRRIREYSIVFI